MASRQDIINLLEENLIMSTMQIYKAINSTFPLKTLVENKNIACVHDGEKNQYFLEENLELLPEKLRAKYQPYVKKIDQMSTTELVKETEISLEIAARQIGFSDEQISALVNAKHSIDNLYTEEERKMFFRDPTEKQKEYAKRYAKYKYDNDPEYRKKKIDRANKRYSEMKKIKDQAIQEVCRKILDEIDSNTWGYSVAWYHIRLGAL